MYDVMLPVFGFPILASHDSIMTLREMVYPIGYLSYFFFSARVLIQWILSEQKQQSVTPQLFWHLSVAGNITLALHSFIQGQFPVYVTQTIQCILGWRNMNLASPSPVSFRKASSYIIFAGLGATFVYLVSQQILPYDSASWVRSPKHPSVDVWIHSIGTIGIIALSARFWVQWIMAEMNGTNTLPLHFWYLTILGALLSSLYFFVLSDWVQWVGSSCALVPCIRNLILLKRGTSCAV